ncbi:nucleoporin autopeptidase [Ostertagia ostertagi]
MFGKSSFGSTGSTFGSAGSSLFGQNKPTTNLFGQQSASTQGSLFGQKSTTNLFGQSTPTAGTSIFGSSNTGSTTGTSLFGQSKPSLFGGSSTTGTTSLFGSSTTSTGGGLFGSTASTVNGTTVKFEPLVSSDTMMKNGSQTTIQTKHMCITAMKAYEGKSIEELRIEDYIANRKTPSASGGLFGSSTATNAGSSIFGSTPAKPSLFGSSTSTTSPFGATQGTSLFSQNNNATQGSSLFGSKPTGSLFGSPATGTTSTFGSTGGSLFGNTGTSTFGTPQQTGSLFGGSTFGAAPTTTSSFTFGSNTNTTASPFGQTATSTTGGLFGSNTAAASTGSLFGKPAGTSTFSFGTPSNTTFGQTTSGGLFGNTQKPGGLFGSTTNTTGGSLFGSQPAQQSTGLFGSTQPAQTSLFGANTANQQANTSQTTSGGLFGNTQKPGGLFGSTTNTTGGSLFGSQPAQQSTGLFGSTQPAQTSLFGANTANQQANTSFGAAAPTTINVPAAAPIVLGSDVNQAQIQMALLDAQIAACPYGDSPLLKMGSAKDTDDTPNPINTQRQLKFLAAKSAKSSPLNTSTLNGTTGSPSLNGSLISSKSSFLPVVPAKVGDTVKPSPRGRTAAIPGRDLSYTPNVAPPTLGKGIRTNALNSANSITKRSLDGSLINKTVDAAIETSLANGTNMPNSGRRRNLKHLDLSMVMQVLGSRSSEGDDESQGRDPDELPSTDNYAVDNHEVYSPELDPREVAIKRGEACRNGTLPRFQLDGSACEESVMASSKSSVAQATTVTSSSASSETARTSPRVVTSSSSQAIVRLNAPDYFTEPTINAMREMVVEGKVILNNGLTVGRATYGSVFWPGRIELENVALDEIVIFRHKEVTVYPDESKKPPLGEGLNRPAEVTLERVWYIDRNTKEEIRDPLKLIDLGWRDRLEKVTARMGATFKDYRPSTGSWVFRVEHFSKYGLPDDECDSDVAVVPKAQGGSAHGNISAHDLDTSLEEQHIQSYVQRARVPRVELHTEGDESNHEMIIETEVNVLPRRHAKSEVQEFQVPEKKPKMEDVVEYVYEESKRLMELSTLSARPVRRITLTRREPSNVFRGGVEASKTVGYKKSKMINVACAQGSSSRVSWSGQFSFSIQPTSNEVQICALQFDSNVPKQLIVDMLEHNLRLSRTIRRNASTSARVRHCEIEGQPSAPRVKPADDSALELLDCFLATATQSECVIEQRVWRLCQALFPSDKSGQWHWQRSHDVGEWLRDEVAALPSKRVTAGTATVSQVWARMCAGDSEEAMRIASEDGMTMLSSMICEALSAEEKGRGDCADMLQLWETIGDIGTMEEDLLKIYLVLAGKTHLEFQHRGKTVKLNCLEGLDWRQAFGIHLWWVNCGGFLEDAVDSFSEDVAAGRAASPDSHVFEQLIRLACSPSHQIEAVLDAASMLSPNPLDAHLSWHLWSLLRALGYNTMSPAAEQRLHTSYSSLLTSLELWHLAIFVLSHISHDQCRTAAIREVLDRMSLTARSQEYERIAATCEIPNEWIASAKFANAKAQGNYELACSYVLTACDYASALQMFAEEVAPNAIADG